MRLKISARKSDLARLQAYTVGDSLKQKFPELEIQYFFKESLGDKNLTEPLWKIPEKGVFTEDFYSELISGETDLVVHSWKDLPTENKPDSKIAATLARADQRDLLLVKRTHLDKIRQNKKFQVFSSSPRREYNLTDFLKTHLPFPIETVKFESVRGNIPTRLRKLLETEDIDGLVVAKAALDRLLSASQQEFKDVQRLLRSYLKDLNWMVLPLSVNPNAAAQGALAIEIATHRDDLTKLLESIHDESSFICAQKERDLLAQFGGGCHQKIGVAVIKRPYGEITLLRGLTDQGQVLNCRVLNSSQVGSTPTFAQEQLWSAEVIAQRIPLEFATLPPATNAAYVARNEAWPETMTSPEFVWASGLKTWKNLAQRGIWVHGCSESLGEEEDPRIDILAGKSLSWAKLSHEDSGQALDSNYPLIATYSLKLLDKSGSLTDKESFFWNSGSQFLQAVKDCPEILGKHHACGPGNTYKVIRSYMEKNNVFDPSHLIIFLDQESWSQRCTK